MSFLKNYIAFVNKLNTRIGAAASWLTTILVAVVCLDVLSRYLFNESVAAVPELEWHIFAVIFLMGAAYTLKLDQHVRVDLIYSRCSPKVQAIINIIGVLLFMLPFCVIVIYVSQDFVMSSFSVRETSPDPSGLPARYILKAVLPLSFVFIVLQGLSLMFESVLKLTEKKA